jgi:TPP-dependent pyruvate/acetoin dehydrogenase alpha subunit
LLALGLTEADVRKLETDAEVIIADALEFAQNSPLPESAAAFEDVFAPMGG